MRVALLAALLLLTGLRSASAASPEWTMRDLGTLGGAYSLAFAINDSGVVAGTSRVAGRSWPHARHVFVWARGQMRDVGDYGGDTGGSLVLDGLGGVAWPRPDGSLYWNGRETSPLPIYPMAANESGVVVGSAGDRAALWSGGRTTFVDGLPGDVESSASTIDDTGVVAGDSGPWERGRPFLWHAGGLTALVRPQGYAWCSVVAVNKRSHVVGICGTASGSRRRSFLWRSASETVLIGWQETTPITLGDDDTVTGEIPGRRTQGFIWHDGHLRLLGTLGGRQTFVYDADDHGRVVGSSYTKSGNLHAFVWEDGRMTDLARQGPFSLSEAYAINNRGEIAGYSRTGVGGQDNGEIPTHAVLWRRG